MSCTVLRLLKTYLKPHIRLKHGFNSCDKGLTQGMVTTTAAVTSTMQIVEYHVMYNTTTDKTHLKQTTVVVIVTSTTEAYSAGSVRPKS
jgi:hypothetical protein